LVIFVSFLNANLVDLNIKANNINNKEKSDSIKLSGDVIINYDKDVYKGNKVEIFFDKNPLIDKNKQNKKENKIKKYEIVGSGYIYTENKESNNSYKCIGEHIEYDVVSDVVEITGVASVVDLKANRTISGDKIIIDKANSTINSIGNEKKQVNIILKN
jgi:lipopolysaccharide transport protein LptA